MVYVISKLKQVLSFFQPIIKDPQPIPDEKKGLYLLYLDNDKKTCCLHYFFFFGTRTELYDCKSNKINIINVLIASLKYWPDLKFLPKHTYNCKISAIIKLS